MHARINDASIFFDVVGATLAVTPTGMAQRPTVVALHGGPGLDHSGLRPWLDDLSEVAQLIYLDHRGNGRSSRHDPSSYTMAQLADDVEGLRIHLGLDEVIVLGHSFGGKVAQEFARRHPDSLAALVLVDTAPGAQFGHDAQAAAAARATPAQLDVLPSLFRGEIVTAQDWDNWWQICLPLYFAAPERSADAMAAMGARAISAPEVARHMMRHETPHFDARPDLPSIDVPALVVVGRHDWVTPVGQSKEMAELLPHARLVVFEESGHMPHIEQQAEFIAAVSDFIKEVAR